MFAIENDANGKVTHCGVLEFSAAEGTIYLPLWVMKSIGVRSGDFVTLRNVTLQLGTFVKLQPQSVAFLDITDPRAVLEHSFRAFSALTRGDIIQISYNDQVYEFAILEVMPESAKRAICIVETDLQVDFAPPVGYVEPTPQPRAEKSIAGSLGMLNMSQMSQSPFSGSPSASLSSSFKPFSGMGNKLREGQTPSTTPEPSSMIPQSPTALKLPPGMLFFGGQKPKPADDKTDNAQGGFKAFGGSANKLR